MAFDCASPLIRMCVCVCCFCCLVPRFGSVRFGLARLWLELCVHFSVFRYFKFVAESVRCVHFFFILSFSCFVVLCAVIRSLAVFNLFARIFLVRANQVSCEFSFGNGQYNCIKRCAKVNIV